MFEKLTWQLDLNEMTRLDLAYQRANITTYVNKGFTENFNDLHFLHSTWMKKEIGLAECQAGENPTPFYQLSANIRKAIPNQEQNFRRGLKA